MKLLIVLTTLLFIGICQGKSYGSSELKEETDSSTSIKVPPRLTDFIYTRNAFDTIRASEFNASRFAVRVINCKPPVVVASVLRSEAVLGYYYLDFKYLGPEILFFTFSSDAPADAVPFNVRVFADKPNFRQPLADFNVTSHGIGFCRFLKIFPAIQNPRPFITGIHHVFFVFKALQPIKSGDLNIASFRFGHYVDLESNMCIPN